MEADQLNCGLCCILSQHVVGSDCVLFISYNVAENIEWDKLTIMLMIALGYSKLKAGDHKEVWNTIPSPLN